MGMRLVIGDVKKLYLTRCFICQGGGRSTEEHNGQLTNDAEDAPKKAAEGGVAAAEQQQQPGTDMGTKKPGGWRAMPFIIGNETFERLATFGMFANFTVYLVTRLHIPQVKAANVANIWFGTTNFAPLLGAFLSDAYLGRFRTLAYASIASLLGMVCLTLTASVPEIQPPACSTDLVQQGTCMKPPSSLVALLFLSLGLLTVGAGGIRPCSLPFGVDQFDPATEKGRKGIASFFNWYYFTFTVAIMVAITLIVYIQDKVSWALGFAIPTGLMAMSIVLFFLGTRIYIHVPPEGSVLSGVAQVVVAAYCKRSVRLPESFEEQLRSGFLYDPEDHKNKDSTGAPVISTLVTKLPLTEQFSFLNKAAVVLDGELKPDGTPVNPWRLCSVQKVEELKCLIRIAPIWASGFICFVAMAQQGTFAVLQALKMDRHFGPNFEVPAGSLGVISMLAISIFIPIYDRALVPVFSRITGLKEGGITNLQRMGLGMFVSILAMVAAGLVEAKRRNSALAAAAPHGVAPISVLWLSAPLALMGVAEGLNGVAQIEFYYRQFPEHMRSIAGALFSCSFAGASYLSSVLITVVHKYTGRNGHPNWLADDINAGRLDYFFYLLVILGIVNLAYFVICAHYYRYKPSAPVPDGFDEGSDMEIKKAAKEHV